MVFEVICICINYLEVICICCGGLGFDSHRGQMLLYFLQGPVFKPGQWLVPFFYHFPIPYCITLSFEICIDICIILHNYFHFLCMYRQFEYFQASSIVSHEACRVSHEV